MSTMVGDDLHEEITDDVAVNQNYADVESDSIKSKSIMRSLWLYEGKFHTVSRE